MLNSIIRLGAIFAVFVSYAAFSQSLPARDVPAMAQLRDMQKDLLDQMNAPGSKDQAARISDTRMGPLLSNGWQLAVDWASAWFDRHPNPSANDLTKLFVEFTPPPAYPEVYDPAIPDHYAMEGDATRIAVDAYVVTSTYETGGSEATSTFFVTWSRFRRSFPLEMER